MTDRYHRQELLLGKEGQQLLKVTSVAIVGLGGLGSHVAQQLAYLGTKTFSLIDAETAEITNLNRLIGASDNDLNRLKVEIARALILGVEPEASIHPVATTLLSTQGFGAIRESDFVVGCVDRDDVRFVLNELCQAYEKPYLDLATDFDPTDKSFGGRLVYADGRGCVVCMDALDPDAMRLAMRTDQQRREDDKIYGVRTGALEGVGPAVVSLNGIIASLGVTEFLAAVTGLRPANLYLEYRGTSGVVTRQTERVTTGCYYCAVVRGARESSDVERYVLAS